MLMENPSTDLVSDDHNIGMRYLILSLMFLSLHAADGVPSFPREDFTLTDGRTFTGTFDEAANTLTLDGGKIGLHVTADQIQKREPAKEAMKPAEVKAPAVVIKPVKPSESKPQKPQSREDQVAQMEKEIAAMEAKAKAAWAEADKIRVNPRNSNPKLEAVPEWIIGTPEYNEREQRLNKLLADVMGFERAAMKMRELADKTREGNN